MAPRDKVLIETILEYCGDIQSAIDRFSLTEEIILEDNDFRVMLAFFISQIGESARSLSKEFTDGHPEIEWKAIVGFRNRIIHAYGKIIPVILWDSATHDVPELRDFCKKMLNK